MTKLSHLAFVATVLLTGATSAIAQTADRSDLRTRAASVSYTHLTLPTKRIV